jgi:hypothetical protein
MKVVFMLPYPVDGFRWTTEQFGIKAIMEKKRLADYYAWDANVQRASERIRPAAQALTDKGIEVDADIYAGGMTRAIRGYAANADVHLIVTRLNVAEKIAGLVAGSNSLSALFKRSSFSPVLLIHPNTVA